MVTSPQLFLGRDAEIDALERVLDGGVRLVTIVGPLGAGKTRLASEFCARRGDATCFVDLTDVFERDAFLRKVASALGVSLIGDAEQQLCAALSACDFDVVVFDNFEQIVGAARDIVGRFVSTPNAPTFVVTTREALDLAEEVRIALGSLPGDAAVELFEKRARAVLPTFTVADADRVVVAELLAGLDNLPLVIELAAARVSVLPPAQLLRRLTDRFQHVRETEPKRTPRQASLQGAIAWSWDLLDADERRALAQSSVFRGGFSLEAAEAILDAPDPIAMTQKLVDKSLLRREASRRDPMDVRFRHYESIRAFAADRLEGEDTAAAHAGFFEEVAQVLDSCLKQGADAGTQADAFAQLDEEFGNLLEALRVSGSEQIGLAVDELLEARGPAGMRKRVLTSWTGAGAGETRRLVALAETELSQGRLDAAESWLYEARRREPHVETELTAGRIQRARGDIQAAERAARAAIELADSPSEEARARANLAVATEDLDEAREQCEISLRLLARDPDARLAAMVRNVAGTLAMMSLDLDTATAHFGRVLPDAGALGEARLQGAALSNLALVGHYRGELDDAAYRFGAAAEALRKTGLLAEAAMATGNRAAVLIEQQHWAKAATDLADADEILGGRGGAVEGVIVATRAWSCSTPLARMLRPRPSMLRSPPTKHGSPRPRTHCWMPWNRLRRPGSSRESSARRGAPTTSRSLESGSPLYATACLATSRPASTRCSKTRRAAGCS
jgi:predicted ATPase